MVRIAAPIYLKTGGSVARTHSWDTTAADAKQSAKQVQQVKRVLDEYYPGAVTVPPTKARAMAEVYLDDLARFAVTV